MHNSLSLLIFYVGIDEKVDRLTTKIDAITGVYDDLGSISQKSILAENFSFWTNSKKNT
jgi:hypothetical protein